MSTAAGIGILLCNLGTPSAPTTSALRVYLKQFLSDPRVVELPRAQWLPVLHAFVLPFRPRKSAALYQKIWTDEGSPLLLLSERLRAAIGAELHEEFPVELGMRYGDPSIASALRALERAGCSKIVIVPLYPQYSATTTASTFDAVFGELRRWRVVPEVRTIARYAEEPAYIDALAATVRERRSDGGKPEKLLLSFHGIPKRYADAGDPYPDECRRTAERLIARLGLERGHAEVSFQSVFGRDEWIKPATAETVERLARNGVRSLDVLCPGFAVDCLETLEEISQLNAEIFHAAGGTAFRYIPCLNDRPDHARLIAGIVERTAEGWANAEPIREPLLRRS